MSAPTTEVAAAQPIAADATPVETKQEETKSEEQTKQEDVDMKVKQEEASSKTEEPAADPKTEDLKMEDVKPETDSEAKKEESDSKPAPLLKTKAPLKKDISNKKYDASVLPVTNDPDTIRTQFEFYFGDSNLPSDKHMWTITGGPENRPVKVKHICNFARCKRFQPYEDVVAALKDSKHLEVSGTEGDEEIKRKTAYVPASENAQQRLAASVYVKGFGDETPTTQFDIEAFFARYGPVNVIRLRRTEEDYFKGSVFVEFPSEEAAKAFLALDPAPTYQGHELKIMSKKAYIDEKNQLIKEGKLEPRQQHKKFWEGRDLSNKGRGRGGRGGGGGRGRDDRNTDPNDWKKRRDNDQRNGNGGRGGRGRGRGGRGRGGDRNGRDGGRDNRRRDEAAPASTNNVQKPRINASAPGDELKKENGKRAREDDGAATSEPPAKKADTKTEAAAPAERKD
ncbi:La domain-containing protein [Coniochaeta sp. 2T2.1]|nr:La domain-containing protein [Coniochaeta sp. 2T2.1]